MASAVASPAWKRLSSRLSGRQSSSRGASAGGAEASKAAMAAERAAFSSSSVLRQEERRRGRGREAGRRAAAAEGSGQRGRAARESAMGSGARCVAFDFRGFVRLDFFLQGAGAIGAAPCECNVFAVG